jgi:hypothetical protein
VILDRKFFLNTPLVNNSLLVNNNVNIVYNDIVF